MVSSVAFSETAISAAGVVADAISLSEFSDTGCVTLEAGGVGGCTSGDCRDTFEKDRVGADGEADATVVAAELPPPPPPPPAAVDAVVVEFGDC